MQAFREAYREYCSQLDISPLYELTEDALVESSIQQSGHCNLQACNITTADVIALAQTLKFHPILESLDLRDNQLDDMAALGLAETIAATGLPARLDLRKNALTDVGGQDLLDVAQAVPSLVALNLEGNQLSAQMLAAVQRVVADRKQAAASKPKAAAPREASKKRGGGGSGFSDDDDDDDDDGLDLGFDSEVRGRKSVGNSPSLSLSLGRDDPEPLALDASPLPSPVAPAASRVLTAAAPAASASAIPAADSPARDRSSFSLALEEANDAANASTTDLGGDDEEFDWDKADTDGLLDGDGAPTEAAESRAQVRPEASFAATPASVSPALRPSPPPAAAPSATVTKPAVAAPALPPKPAPKPVPAAAVAPVPASQPSSSPADELDEFNFDDDLEDLMQEPAASTPPPAAAATAPAPAPAPAPASANDSFPSSPALASQEGLLGPAQLRGEAPIVDNEWGRSPSPSRVAPPRDEDPHDLNLDLDDDHDHEDDPHLAKTVVAPAAIPATTKASDTSRPQEDEFDRAQAALRAQMDASRALAVEASRSTLRPTPAAAAPVAAAAPTAATSAARPTGIPQPRANTTASAAPVPSRPTPTTAISPRASSHNRAPSSSATASSFTGSLAPSGPVSRPTLLPSSVALWNSDPDDPSASRVDLSHRPGIELVRLLPHLTSLRSLTLRGCGLTQLPPLPATLERLDVARNSLRTFGRSLDATPRLLELCASQNTIGALETSLRGATALRIVDLSENAIRSVAGLAHLRALQMVDLRSNAIPAVPALRELSLCTRLRVLRIAGNPLTAAFQSGGGNGGARGLKHAVLALLPHLTQLDTTVLVLPVGDAGAALAARGGASLLHDADTLDVADLVAAITAAHGPAIRRLVARVANAAAASDKTSATAESEPTVTLPVLLAHLQHLAFVPYFLPEADAKVLLSLLAAPGSGSGAAAAPRLGTAAFIELIARAACIKQTAVSTRTSGGVMPAALKTYVRTLREAHETSPLFDDAFHTSLFFEPDAAFVPPSAHAWVFANYAIKLLGLMVQARGAPNSAAAASTTANTAAMASLMRPTSTSASRRRAPSPAPTVKAASTSGSARKRRTGPGGSDDSTSSGGGANKGPSVYERLYYAKPTPKPSPPPVAPARATPRRAATPVRSASATRRRSQSPAHALDGPAGETAAMRAARYQRLQEEAAEEEELAAAEADAAAREAEALAAAEDDIYAHARASDLHNDNDYALNDDADYDDAHYLPPAVAAASTATMPMSLSLAATLPAVHGGSENTISPTRGKVLRARAPAGGPSVAQRAAQLLEETRLRAGAAPLDDFDGSDDSSSLSAGGAAAGLNLDDESWLDDVDVSTARGIKRIIRSLNEKINKLYNWHLVEIDLVSRQQMQLNSLKTDMDATRASAAPTPVQQHHTGQAYASAHATAPLIFEPLSPAPSQASHIAHRTPISNPAFSPVQHHHQTLRASPQPQPTTMGAPAPAPDAASSDDWTSLMHALAVLEQTDPNCAEVQVLRDLLRQEQMQTHIQTMQVQATPQHQQQQVSQMQMQGQLPYQQQQQQPLYQQPLYQQQQQQRHQQPPPQSTLQMPTQPQYHQAPQYQPPQSQQQQQQPLSSSQHFSFGGGYPSDSPRSSYPAPAALGPPSPQNFAPASFVSHPPSVSAPTPLPATSASLVGGSLDAAAASVLASFWVSDVSEWCRELDEELKTATMALGNILALTAHAGAPEEYSRGVRDFEHILAVSGMLVSFGLPSHVAALLTILPGEVLAAIRAAAHRLEATKKSLHAFLALVHAEPPNSRLVREMRETIEQSGVTVADAHSTLEEAAKQIARKIALQQVAQTRPEQTQTQTMPPPPQQPQQAYPQQYAPQPSQVPQPHPQQSYVSVPSSSPYHSAPAPVVKPSPAPFQYGHPPSHHSAFSTDATPSQPHAHPYPSHSRASSAAHSRSSSLAAAARSPLTLQSLSTPRADESPRAQLMHRTNTAALGGRFS